MMSRKQVRGSVRTGLTALAAAAALVAGTIGTSVPAAAGAELPEPDLRYAMDELQDGTVPDTSGHGWDGAVTGAAELIETDEADSALALSGGDDGGYVQIPRGILDGAQDLTVSVRMQWGGIGGAWQWIYALGSDTDRYLFSTPSNGDGNLRSAITVDGSGGESTVTGYGALQEGDWVTVTTTLDTTAEQLITYLDGVPVDSVSTNVQAGDLLADDASSAGFIGRSFYPDPLLEGAIEDFQIYRTALDAEQVAGLVGETPSIESVTEESFDVRTKVGEAPELPASVRATYSDGYDRNVPIEWEDVNPDSYAQTGEFTVTGVASGVTVTADVVVHRGEIQVDLGTDTGDFHGGASGSLYGLYGPGLPSDNLIEGMGIRTISTKAQDGPQHPGADALEVVRPLADATDGDVYIYMTDIHRGFPYQWPGDTPEEKLDTYMEKIAAQVEQVLQLPKEYQDNIVFVPFNEPEGNMFGTGEWSYDGTSWLDAPAAYFAAWDRAYAAIKDRMPQARIAGPNTSVLFDEVESFLEHTVQAGTVPDVVTWHELSHPEQIRDSVATYRSWEEDVFTGTEWEGTELPININEYAFNYHTSVPGQMIQWISAIEEAKVDADIAYWNIDGNLSDSAVQSNRGNGQWWLYNAYSQMTGHTVEVTPPHPGQNYTLQGVATLDEDRAIARTILGGADGSSAVEMVNVPEEVFGDEVRLTVTEIPWTGQVGDSAQPRLLTETTADVDDGAVTVEFDDQQLPVLDESSAYEVVMTPAGTGTSTAVPPSVWDGSYEAEDAEYTGSGYSLNGPEGSPSDVSKFYTSGGYDVGGLRTGSDGQLSFEVTVPEDGTYDLSVFANSLNTYDLIAEHGPTNVFLRVDGAAEQELFLPLAYKWVVWDHTDTEVELTAGTHTITLAAQSLDGSGATQGDAIIDRITLSLPNPSAGTDVHEAELATTDGTAVYDADELPGSVAAEEVSGAGGIALDEGNSLTFWVYGAEDAESTLGVDLLDRGTGALAVNGRDVLDLGEEQETAVHLDGGVNKVVVTAGSGGAVVDRLLVTAGTEVLPQSTYQAEDALTEGNVEVVDLPRADGGRALSGIGGAPGNENNATFRVDAAEGGPHAVVFRYSNPEQSPASHYNPDPIARRADITVNDQTPVSVLFPHTFHENNFWEKTVVLDLEPGVNSITVSSQEATNFDGETYASDVWPDFALRSQWAPIIDQITVSPLARAPQAGEPEWSADEAYTAGDRVTYEGALFEATWWTRGQEPGDSPYSSWQEISQTPDGMVIWTPSRIFTAGDVVVHEGQEYTAKWWTRNQEPGDPHGPWELSE